MKRILFYIIIIIISTYSCNVYENKSGFSSLIKNAKHLKGKIVSKKDQIYTEPLKMRFQKPYLIYYSTKEQKLIKVFNTDKGVVEKRYCDHGRGPNELMTVGNIQKYGNKIYLYDVGKKNYYFLDLFSGELNKISVIDPYVLQAYYIPKNNIFFVNGIFSDSRFRTYSKRGNVINKYTTFPDFKINIKDTTFLNLGYQNMMDISPDGSKIVNIVYNSEIVECYRVDKKNRIINVWKYEGSFIPFTPIGSGNMKMVEHSLSSFGFRNVSANNELICCVYSKKTVKESIPRTASGSYLVLFDWKGKLKKAFIIDHPVRTIAITLDSKWIYGTALIDNEIKILKYEIQ